MYSTLLWLLAGWLWLKITLLLSQALKLEVPSSHSQHSSSPQLITVLETELIRLKIVDKVPIWQLDENDELALKVHMK